MYSRYQGIDDARAAIVGYEEQISALRKAFDETNDLLEKLNGEESETRLQLASGLLLSVDEDEVSIVSSEIGAIFLKTKLSQLQLQFEQDKTNLQKNVDSDIYRTRKSYIDPVTGSISLALKENNELLSQVKSSIEQLENSPHFFWVKNEYRSKQGLLKLIFDFITFTFLYRKKRFNKCKDVVGPLDEAFVKHDDFLRHKKEISEHVKKLLSEKKVIEDVVSLVDYLTLEVDNFETSALKKLRMCIAEHLRDLDFTEVLGSIRDDARILVSKLDALSKKTKHIQDMKYHIESEISDREQRKSKVQTVLTKWTYSSRTHLSGDKSKWLVATPLNCKKRTKRYIEAYANNRNCIYNYSDYIGYHAALSTGLMFSSFTLFADGVSVDSYAAQGIYSEYRLLHESTENGIDILEDSALLSAVEDMESDMEMGDFEGSPDSMDAS